MAEMCPSKTQFAPFAKKLVECLSRSMLLLCCVLCYLKLAARPNVHLTSRVMSGTIITMEAILSISVYRFSSRSSAASSCSCSSCSSCSSRSSCSISPPAASSAERFNTSDVGVLLHLSGRSFHVARPVDFLFLLFVCLVLCLFLCLRIHHASHDVIQG